MQKSKFSMSAALAMATLGLGLPHAVTVGANGPDAQQAREAAGQKNEASKGTPARAGATERAIGAAAVAGSHTAQPTRAPACRCASTSAQPARPATWRATAAPTADPLRPAAIPRKAQP